jgi:hypothetical protein
MLIEQMEINTSHELRNALRKWVGRGLWVLAARYKHRAVAVT